jgi:hypothetical protein
MHCLIELPSLIDEQTYIYTEVHDLKLCSMPWLIMQLQFYISFLLPGRCCFKYVLL